jgi:SAM-dependent methyltransferase
LCRSWSGRGVPALLDLAELRSGERVLDIATGTGVVARLAVRRVNPGGAVTGLDLNEGMLKEARRLPLPLGLTVDWRQGSALALPSPTTRTTSCAVNKGFSSSRGDGVNMNRWGMTVPRPKAPQTTPRKLALLT